MVEGELARMGGGARIHHRGGLLGLRTLGELAATLLTVFVIVGLFQVWVADAFVMRHLGDSSGFKGLALGADLGTVLHGPLVSVFPLLKALLSKGARVGVVVASVSTWAIKLPMIPLELRLFGWKFTPLREGLLFASAFIMAPLMELMLGKAM
ncbi:MAG: permease [Actinomycetia bacterium]|nr:permease [Actinomycetes bacterium]